MFLVWVHPAADPDQARTGKAVTAMFTLIMPEHFYCPECGIEVKRPSPEQWVPGMMLFCSGACAETHRLSRWEVDRCPACGEPDPDAEHDGRTDSVHAEYRQWADEMASREYMEGLSEAGFGADDEG